jgi:hypothetical protein
VGWRFVKRLGFLEVAGLAGWLDDDTAGFLLLELLLGKLVSSQSLPNLVQVARSNGVRFTGPDLEFVCVTSGGATPENCSLTEDAFVSLKLQPAFFV